MGATPESKPSRAAGRTLVGSAQAAESSPDELAQSSNTLFILIGAIMILAMHGGFAFLEVGSVRRKNQVNALNKIICEWGFSTIVYFLIGYPIARGVSFLVPVETLAANHGFAYVKFFLLLGFAACIPAIISGGVAERARRRWRSFVLFSADCDRAGGNLLPGGQHDCLRADENHGGYPAESARRADRLRPGGTPD